MKSAVKGKGSPGRWDMRFAHAVARVWMLESRLLDAARFDRLLSAESVGEALKILAETEYGPALAALKGGGDWEQALESELERVYAFVSSFSPEPRLLAAWRDRHTFHNLKALLKEALRGEPVDASVFSGAAGVEREELQSLVNAALGGRDERAHRVVIPLPQVPTSPPRVRVGGQVGERSGGSETTRYLAEAAATALAAFRATGAPEEIDQAVDRCYQEYLLELARVPGGEFLRGYVDRFADLTNLRTYIRFAVADRPVDGLRRALLPGGVLDPAELVEAFGRGSGEEARLEAVEGLTAGSPYATVVAEGLRLYRTEGLLSGYEGLMEGFLQAYLKGDGQSTFSFAPVWAYLMAKEREVKTIRLILVGKSAGVSPALLRERMPHVNG
ncbi:MAG: V-type ATPase subunit [Chitinophagales bacterium]